MRISRSKAKHDSRKLQAIISRFPRLGMVLQFIVGVVQNFLRHDGLRIAAHLTFTSLFAVIPVMTVTYAILAMMPNSQEVSAEIQQFIFDHFMPSSSATLQGYFNSFTDQARKLTGVGLVMLFVTSVLMLRNIERAFNVIWQAVSARSMMSALLLYWFILTIGPLCMGLALAIPSYIASLNIVDGLSDLVDYKTPFVLSLLPIALSTVALSLAYITIPNTKVVAWHGIVGGLLAALGLDLARRILTSFVTQFPSYELIYGAFAAMPIFLIWIYLSWLIVILGAEVANALGRFKNPLHRSKRSWGPVLAALEYCYSARKQGSEVDESDLLAAIPSLYETDWPLYKSRLKDSGYLIETKNEGLALNQDLHCITLFDLFFVLYPNLQITRDMLSGGEWATAALDRSRAGFDALKVQWDIPVAALFDSI